MGFLGALLDFYRTMGYTSAMTDLTKQERDTMTERIVSRIVDSSILNDQLVTDDIRANIYNYVEQAEGLGEVDDDSLRNLHDFYLEE